MRLVAFISIKTVVIVAEVIINGNANQFGWLPGTIQTKTKRPALRTPRALRVAVS